MQKKGFIAVLSAIVLMIVASVSLVLAVGHNASADSEPVLIPIEYLNIHDGVLGDNPFWDGTDAFTMEGLDYIYELSSAYRVVIPDSVTSIDNGAFYNCTNLTSVTIPDSVTSIGDGAFYGCTSLTSITIPDSVTEIENFIFEGCTSLTSVTISDSVTSIGDCMFEGCTSLTNITLSDNIESIGECAFGGCTSLTNVTIPDSVTSIGDYAFAGCYNLTSIFIPETVKYMGTYVFTDYECEIYCEAAGRPSGWTDDFRGSAWWAAKAIVDNNYEPNVYWNCKLDGNIVYQLTEDEDASYVLIGYVGDVDNVAVAAEINHLPVIVIDDYAFYWCENLTTITIPANINVIGNSAFENCTNLTSVTLGNGVEEIGFNTFRNCDSLTSITIPNSVEYMGEAVFTGCDNLDIIYCECSQAYADENWEDYWDYWYEEDGDWRSISDICVWNYVIPEYTITFNTNSGSLVDDQTIRDGNKANVPETPTKTGYTFAGWYTDAELQNAFDFDTIITEDVTLYAKWEEIIVTPEPEQPEPSNPEQPTTPDTDTETVTVESKDNFNLGAAIGGGVVAGIGTISAIAATIIARKRRK